MRRFLRRERLLLLFTLFLMLALIAAIGVGCSEKKTEVTDEVTEDEEVETVSGLAWPMPYRDIRRTGRCPVNGPGTAEVEWTFEGGTQTRAWAVIAGDGNVVTGFEGKVVSVDPETGTLAWEFSTGGAKATTCRVVEDGTIYTSAANIVYALSGEGEKKWSYDVGGEADEPSVGEDGTVYVGSVGGKLVALSEDGKLQWDFNVDGDIRSPSFDEEGNLYCGASPIAMYALDAEGNQKWEFKPEGELPLYENMFAWANTLEIPSIGDDGTIYAGSALTGGITTTGQQIADYAIPQQAKVYAITPEGEKKWDYSIPENKWVMHTPSIGRDGTLYAGTGIYRVIALNPDGTLLWEFNTGEGQDVCPSVYSPPIGKDGLLYAATTSAKIFCITPEGTEKWRFTGGDPWLPGMAGSNNFTPPAIGEDGTLFSVLAQGTIYALKPTPAE